ncbi:cytochrome P450 CYP72A219-like [Coffea eugenioides]|uniref:cytochrome P450 CYP72A219-like n=1 Tax=Coffea eugenioides TaxID=49369 RepID=UPI000F60626A|nr:cytochrome P450 CYP72A219-like [Coffea eugenioides]
MDRAPAAYLSSIVLVTALSSAIFLVALAWKLFKWVWLNPKKLEKLLRQQGFRGNSYIPVLGDVIAMSTLLKQAHSKPINLSDDIVPRIIPEYLDLVKKHGKNTYIWYGPEPSVCIQDPELIREASQNINLFHKPVVNQLTRLLAPGLISYNGDKWAKHRKLINPAFHGEKLKLMLPSFCTSATAMLRKWEEIISPTGFCELDVWPSLRSLSSDAISRTAFGSNYEEGRVIFELQGEQCELCIKSLWSMLIPGWRFLPTKRNRRMGQIFKDVTDSIREIINSRLNEIRAGEFGDDEFLGLLLQSNSQEIDRHGNKDFGMTIEEVIEECRLFYVAGQETTSVLLVWTLILLSVHQEWQTRARDEVLQVFGTRIPDFDGLNHLKLVTMILHEVLRLYPPIPVNGRITAAETKLGNLSLPSGVLVLIQTLLVHHDQAIWGEDAKEFKPERFSQGASHATKGNIAFFPFGWGPRSCIGQSYAMLEAKLVLAMILQRFWFKLSPSYSHAPISLVTLKPQYGAPLILHKL